MVQITDESKEAGLRTLLALDEQGERLDTIDAGNKQIREDMHEAEKHLRDMDKCCGLFVLPWKKGKVIKEADRVWKKGDDAKIVCEQPYKRVKMDAGVTGGYIGKITNEAYEDEMDENLSLVHTTVGNLRNMALDIGAEVTSQNRQLDIIRQKVDSNEQHVKEADDKAKKLAQ